MLLIPHSYRPYIWLKGQDEMMLIVPNLRTRRPILGEVSTLIILPKYEFKVMQDKESLHSFRDLCLAWNPAKVWDRYSIKSHQKLCSRYTACWLGTNGHVWDRQWIFCCIQQSPHELFLRSFLLTLSTGLSFFTIGVSPAIAFEMPPIINQEVATKIKTKFLFTFFIVCSSFLRMSVWF